MMPRERHEWKYLVGHAPGKLRIPNTQKSYKRVGNVINDARLAGLIDWDAIEDRTRNTITNSHWKSPARILDSVVDSYAADKWADQPYRVEVWIEKEALAGVFEPVGGNGPIRLLDP